MTGLPRTWLLAASLLLAGCAVAMGPAGPGATAELKNAQGRVVGQATFTEEGTAVRIVLDVRGLPSGEKGVHIHAVGRCDPPDFTSAGGHFNPLGKRHGLLNPAGPHAGDLPNIIVRADGSGRLEVANPRVGLGASPISLFDADGSALVIHAAPDDYKTDPTGNSGARIACGVIVRRAPAAPRSGY